MPHQEEAYHFVVRIPWKPHHSVGLFWAFDQTFRACAHASFSSYISQANGSPLCGSCHSDPRWSVNTWKFCPKWRRGLNIAWKGQSFLGNSFNSLGNLWLSLGILNKSLERVALCFSLYLLVCVAVQSVWCTLKLPGFPSKGEGKRSLPDHRPSESRRTRLPSHAGKSKRFWAWKVDAHVSF